MSSLRTHHKFVHSDEPKQVCTMCGKSFKGHFSLQRHMQMVHSEMKDQKLPCDVCGRVFNQKQILRQHMKRHKKEFSIYCETCGKGFYSNFKLQEHMRSHTGEKPFSCPLCPNFKSSTKTNLQKHLKTHRTEKQKTVRKQTSKANKVAPHRPANQNSTSDIHQNAAPTVTESRDETILLPTGFGQHTADTNTTDLMGRDSSHMQNSLSVPVQNCAAPARYEQPPQWAMMSEPPGSFDNRETVDEYHDNRNDSPSNHISQGLNILTVAMNIVIPELY